MDMCHTRAFKLLVNLGKVYKCLFCLRKERSKTSGLGKVVESDSTWSWSCEQLKLPQRRRRDRSGVVLKFDKHIIESSFRFAFLVVF
jgi:hypothetical protein